MYIYSRLGTFKISRPWVHRILACVVVVVVIQLFVAITYMLSPHLMPQLLHAGVSMVRHHQHDLSEHLNDLGLQAQNIYRERGQREETETEPFRPHEGELFPRKWPVPTDPGKVPDEWLALKNNSGQCSQCPFKERNGIFCLEEDNQTYIRSVGNVTCLIEGTDWNATTVTSRSCQCLPDWSGPACNLPFTVSLSDLSSRFRQNLTMRTRPRRIIHAFPFNMEFDLLQARIAEIGDLVDVFMILESNYTAYGEPRALQLLPKLQQGAFSEIACKIVYVFLDFFPKKAYYNGVLADRMHRDYIGSHGVATQLRSYRHDDIFLLMDADEIPARNTLLFLKLHDGYPESFGLYLRWNVYGFFWAPGGNSRFDAGMTMGMLNHVVGVDHALDVRYSSSKLYLYDKHLNTYMKAGGIVSPWSFGSEETSAGWHCSWCFPPEGIRTKLTSAVNADFPRWGDYPEKLRLDYIASLIREGKWFDDQGTFSAANPDDINYAPAHILQHKDKYKHLLVNGYL